MRHTCLISTEPRPREIPRGICTCSRPLLHPTLHFPSFVLSSFLLFCTSFLLLVASYDVTLGQGPKAAPKAVASHDATRPAAAEGPANSSVPKQQRVGARRVLLRRTRLRRFINVVPVNVVLISLRDRRCRPFYSFRATPPCDGRSEGDRRRHRHTPFATQEKRSNERRRHVTSEAKGPTAPRAHAVCNAREAAQ